MHVGAAILSDMGIDWRFQQRYFCHSSHHRIVDASAQKDEHRPSLSDTRGLWGKVMVMRDGMQTSLSGMI